ncbi:hypothetical protein PBY51_011052 [Eleginops maclovinus]|uniref:Uncharacterized protein n=1 Tax=Eleginops maclovinus TaxID=56733 RepID=A0AAN7XBT3_ELEMC|nr:hypothetical protein PBY51_011052 [Eleginops maclovinus]
MIDSYKLQSEEEVFSADSAPPLQPEASLSLRSRPCHSLALSLEPGHCSRKWFLPQVGGAERERNTTETKSRGKRDHQAGEADWK